MCCSEWLRMRAPKRNIEKLDVRSTELISIINFGVTSTASLREVNHGIHLIKNETQILLWTMPTGKKVSPNEINCGMTAQCTVYLLNIFSLHNYDAIWARVKYEYDIKFSTTIRSVVDRWLCHLRLWIFPSILPSTDHCECGWNDKSAIYLPPPTTLQRSHRVRCHGFRMSICCIETVGRTKIKNHPKTVAICCWLKHSLKWAKKQNACELRK